MKMADKAMKHNDAGQNMRLELKETVSSFIAQIKNPDIRSIIIDSHVLERIKNLAVFCVVARSGVIRDNYSREIIYETRRLKNSNIS